VEQDYNFPDGRSAGSKGDTSESMLSVVLNKKNEAWKIAFLQVTGIDPKAAAQNPVKGQASR
jgi:hypothetical protein